MRAQTIALFGVGIFQIPLLLHFSRWLTRGVGKFDLDLTRVFIGVLGGSTLIGLPLWLLGVIPIGGNTSHGAKAWFFGLMAGAGLTSLLHALRRTPARTEEPAALLSRCPYCGHFPGYINILLWNRNRPFRCSKCEKLLALDPARTLVLMALAFVPSAIYIVGWGRPEDIPEWVIWAISTPCLLLYPFIAKVVPAEEST